MRIRELREQSGLTRSEVARRMGVKHTSVLQWETGKAMPAAAKLPKRADLFGCSIDALYGRTGPPAAPTTSTQEGGHP